MSKASRQIINLPFYSEGPVVDRDGNIYCTTLSGGYILKFTNNNSPIHWAQSNCPNGQCITTDDEHLICDSKNSSVLRFDMNGKFINKIIDGNCIGHKVYAPNDLIFDSYGGIYFTDSIRQHGKIFYIDKNGNQYLVASEIDYPNGLALSKNEKILYVAESYKNRIIAFSVFSSIKWGHSEIFSILPSGNCEYNLPDGLAVDNDGRLWVAHYGMGAIQILLPSGELADSINMPFPLVSNLFIQNENNLIIVTGGYKEPGPGILLKMTLT